MKSFVLSALFVTLLTGQVLCEGDDYQQASQSFKKGEYAQAVGYIDAILRDDPKNARARFLMGLIQDQQGKTEDAIATFQALSEDYPELPEPYNNLGVLYAGRGEYDKARQELEMAIRTNPTYATAHENLGDIYAKMASQAYDKALQLDKTDTTAKTKLALIKELFSLPSAPTQPHLTVPATPPSGATPSVPAATPGKRTSAIPAGDDITQAAIQWAHACLQNDVNGHLSFYAPNFEGPDGQSPQAWEIERQLRIANAPKIGVKLTALQIRFADKKRAVVTFRQNCHSDRPQTSVTKTLAMSKYGNRWLVQQEHVGG